MMVSTERGMLELEVGELKQERSVAKSDKGEIFS